MPPLKVSIGVFSMNPRQSCQPTVAAVLPAHPSHSPVGHKLCSPPPCPPLMPHFAVGILAPLTSADSRPEGIPLGNF